MLTLEIMLLALTIGATLVIAALTVYIVAITVGDTFSRRKQSDMLEKLWVKELTRHRG